MAIAGGWVDWAQRVTVRQDKRYPEDNRGLGIVWHSQEGTGLQAMINIANREAPPSFMFWISLDGSLYQFAAVTASVWCSGSHTANVRYWPVELEGAAPADINDAQLRTALALISEWEMFSGRIALREGGVLGNQLEHREVATVWTPNAGPTACPSERYARLWTALEDDEPMGLREEIDALKAMLIATGVERAYADGVDLLLSLRNTQTALQSHVDNHPGGGAAVPPHEHKGEVTVK